MTASRSVLSVLAVLLGLAVVVAVATSFLACSEPPSNARIGVDGPSLVEFSTLGGPGDLLDHSCGSLDCHGNAQRNLVMWGCYGLRLDPTATPGCRSSGGTNTSADEYAASYRSLVGLEPALMSEIVANHGDPNQLTFMRKAFGAEAHTGGQVFTYGSDADTCLGTWVQGDYDGGAICSKALAEAP
jgi:hypothetical protein